MLQGANTEQARMIDAGRRRLTDSDSMGELFQVMAITSGDLVAVPGFDSP